VRESCFNRRGNGLMTGQAFDALLSSPVRVPRQWPYWIRNTVRERVVSYILSYGRRTATEIRRATRFSSRKPRRRRRVVYPPSPSPIPVPRTVPKTRTRPTTDTVRRTRDSAVARHIADAVVRRPYAGRR